VTKTAGIMHRDDWFMPILTGCWRHKTLP